jgi:aminomethyltransferase
MLNDRGGVIDDLIIFRLEHDKWYVVVNASTRMNDRQHFESHLTSNARFTDVSDETGKIDLQGPMSRDVLKQLVHDIGKLNYFHFDFFDLLGQNVLISRTGYTGELGYEIFFPANKTADLWRELLKYESVKPAGLGARDMLRLEVGYSLYGHELDQNTSVLESGLKRFIDFDKEFIGKDALLQQIKEGTKRKLAGFISASRRSPRAEQIIYSAQGNAIGRVTSGSFSPAVNAGIGLGFIETPHAVKGEVVFFGDEKNRTEAKISDKIFYTQGSIRA